MSKELSQIITEFPQQLLEGIRVGSSAKGRSAPVKKPLMLLICGMGGSALPGLLLQDIVRAKKLPEPNILVHRNYNLPQESLRASMIVVISYSGNTEEALSSYREAQKHRLPLFVIASGGKLITWAKRDDIPFAELAPDYPPRFALPQLFGALVSLATQQNLLSPVIVQETRAAAGRLRPTSLQKNAQPLAEHLVGRVPLVYSGEETSAVGYIWKIQMNENAKIPAFANTIPELNHNELNTFAQLSAQQSKLRKPFAGLLLREKSETPRLKKRLDITRTLMRESGVPTTDVFLKGQTFTERIFYSVILGAWVSSLLAKRYGVDPLPVTLSEDFKKRLA